MKHQSLALLLLATWCSCAPTKEKTQIYPQNIGDISPDNKIDDAGFKLCNEDRVLQYYNFGKGVQYTGEKAKINEHFRDKLKQHEQSNESGYVTIRFIVNCEGKTGRFRVQGMNNDYEEKAFNENLTDQLSTLTKQLDGWVAGVYEGDTYDYYQYLTFKIENGKLTEIMP